MKSVLKKFVLTCGSLVMAGNLHAQPYGLNQGAAIGAYLNNTLPTTAPNVSASYDVTVAYTNLVFNQPLYLTRYPNTNWMVLIEKAGVIRLFQNTPGVSAGSVQTFLNISSRVYTSSDSGMTAIVFHPEFGVPGSTNRGFVYVTYKWRPNPDLGANGAFAYYRLSRFSVPDGTMAADPNSEVIMLQQFDQQEWHDSGNLMFGQDGYLYFGVGDEGGANDQYNVTQTISERLMSGVFRVDVNQNPTTSHPIIRQPFQHPNTPVGWPASYSSNYFVPNNNPFVNTNGSNLEEYYALGFRNPYRFTQDQVTGLIWVGDVGQSTREEVNILSPGKNYQWAYREGFIAGPKATPGTLIGTEQLPLWDYPHAGGDGCVIGGYVYRGTNFPGLVGKYIVCDNVSGRIWSLTSSNGITLESAVQIANMPPGSVYGGTSSIGQDANGELYFLKIGGTGAGQLYTLKAIVSVIADPATPLSTLGVFTNLTTLAPLPGLRAYTVNSPLWSDAAVKQRWMAVPNDGTHNTAAEQISFSATNDWVFPSGTVFVKHFDLPVNDTNSAILKRVETRLLVMDQNNSAYGLTYKWRANGTDADLLTTGENTDYVITGAGGILRTQTWAFPSRQDCLACHTANAGYVLGLNTHQMNCPTAFAETGVTDNQLRALGHIGMFNGSYNEFQITNYLKSYAVTDTNVSLELRVRSYLDANCAQCHRPGGVYAYLDLRYTTPLASQGLIQGPTHLFITDTNDRAIVPMDLPHSLVHNRANRVGQFQMPPLAKNLVDSNAVAVIAAWINSLPPGPGVTLALANPNTLVSGPFNVTTLFTESVTGVTTNKFIVSNGQITGLTGSGTTYTLTINPLTNGVVTIQFPGGQVTGLSGGTNYTSNTLTANYDPLNQFLTTWLPFEEGSGTTTTDASGNGNNGTLNSMVQAAWTTGKLGVGLSFDGVNDYVGISNHLGTDFTITCWVKTSQIFPTATPTYLGTGIIWSDVGGGAADFIMGGTRSGTGVNRLSFFVGGSETTLSGTQEICTGQWVHLAVTRNGVSGEVRLYVNGVLDGTATAATGLLRANLGIAIGGNTLDNRYFNGLMDDVRFYSTVLSGAEIASFIPPNNSPTISSIANQTIFTNTSTGPIAFTITPGNVPIEGVIVSGSSSSQTLVPNGNIVITGSGTNRTVSVTPAPNQNGTATITLSAFDGSTTVNRTFQLVVNIVPPEPGLLHRWTFNTNANDVISTAHATLVGSATISGNALQIPGGAARVNCATVNLTNTFAANGSVSIETWFTVNTMQDWTKVWMFGRNTGSQPTLCNLSFTPRIGSAGNFPKIEIDPPTAGEMSTVGGASDPGVMSAGVPYHVVTVYDAYNNTMSFYINGVLADSASMAGFNITQLNINECYFGAAVFYSDPNLNGSIDEMRVWNGPLSAARITQNYALGPNTIAGPGYQSPTISALSDMTTTGVATAPQPFTITPGSVALGSLIVSASSSDQTLVPNANIVLGGSGSNRTVTVTPAAGQRGSTTVTVSVNDGTVVVTESYAVIVTGNPVAHYRFEGDAQDSSGNSNHGTANGGFGYAAGKIGSQAMTFNGVNAYVQIPVSVRSNFTIVFWAKTTNTGGTGAWLNGKGFVDGDVSGATTDFGTTLLGAKLGFGVGNANTTISSVTSVNDGQWHLLAVTRTSASGAMNVYVDGVLEATGTGPTGLRAAPPFLRIGCVQSGGAAKFLNGTMDDVRLYDYALSGAEISAMTNTAVAPSITTQPMNQILAIGQSTNPSVVAAGTAPLTYQWRRSGTNLAGANFASLALNNVQLTDAGNYSVVVANSAGSVTSAVAVVTVFNPTLVAGLLHRWSFNNGADTVGGAHATLTGTATYGGGQLQLPGGGAFVNYASADIGNTLSNHASITVETWFTLNQLTDWSKVWMFGRSTAGEPDLSYINFTPRTLVGGNPPKIDFNSALAGEFNTLVGTDPAALATNSQYHVVTIFDAANDVMSYYINGVLADSAPMGGGNITQLNANLARFGAGFFWADPDLNGSINELRIWDGAMNSTQVAANFGNGTETITLVVPRPIISDFSMVAGPAFQLSGAGVVGQTYILQATPNLTAPINWISIGTNTVGGNGQFQFTDSQIVNQPQRFYRIMAQ